MKQEYFYGLADYLKTLLRGSEIYTAYLKAEASDFIRFNHGKIRQPGSVLQGSCSVRLIDQGKQASMTISLVGDKSIDQAQLKTTIEELRAQLPYLPVDPHLLINTEVQSTENIEKNQLCSSQEMVSDILEEAKGTDFVGILASGSIYCGFANSFGQRNWFATHTCNLDWSLVYSADKAVKNGVAGKTWNKSLFQQKMQSAKKQMEILALPSKTLKPGDYRAYLSPVALWEILEVLSWGGFGLNAQRNKVTSLLQLLQKEKSLSPQFSLTENVKEGSAPDFQEDGFLRPDSINLIENGKLTGALISPRSAKEFAVDTNGASGSESPDSLSVAAGDLANEDILSCLDTGVMVGNLWYLNYSDRMSCRLTGMTRFATFWVENGEIVAPINVMRFDDSVYNILGENLERLTTDREFLLSASSYFHRSVGSANLPGAIVRDFRFTL